MSGAAGYAIGRKIEQPFGDVVERVRSELAAEGFGVLSEIDVEAALRDKLGEEVGPYLILGACNPHLAHRGLQVEPDLGVLLPCNVVVRSQEGVTYVSAMEPLSALQLADNPELEPIAHEARERLERALENI